MKKIRVLIVDDSPLIRQVMNDILSKVPDLEVVGQATNGKEGVALAKSLRPDVVTMDVEMPEMTGLEALSELMASSPVRVVMVSTKTKEGASTTLEALELGAIDFVAKPSNAAPSTLHRVADELIEKIRHAAEARLPIRRIARTATLPSRTSDKVVVVASSTGGPRALTTLFQSLPKGLRVPMLIVQHMPEGFTASLAQRLDAIGTMPCKEAKHGDKVQPGLAYVAPGNKHMRVDKHGNIALDEGDRIHGVRPAADHLFVSAVEAWGNKCVGLVLTGMGKDGAAGALAIKRSGGTVFGESQESCTVYGMPKAAKEIGGVNAEFPIDQIGQAMVAALKGDRTNAA